MLQQQAQGAFPFSFYIFLLVQSSAELSCWTLVLNQPKSCRQGQTVPTVQDTMQQPGPEMLTNSPNTGRVSAVRGSWCVALPRCSSLKSWEQCCAPPPSPPPAPPPVPHLPTLWPSPQLHIHTYVLLETCFSNEKNLHPYLKGHMKGMHMLV